MSEEKRILPGCGRRYHDYGIVLSKIELMHIELVVDLKSSQDSV